jgi:hypothetical protein
VTENDVIYPDKTFILSWQISRLFIGWHCHCWETKNPYKVVTKWALTQENAKRKAQEVFTNA